MRFRGRVRVVHTPVDGRALRHLQVLGQAQHLAVTCRLKQQQSSRSAAKTQP
jgi:hypothetical protein